LFSSLILLALGAVLEQPLPKPLSIHGLKTGEELGSDGMGDFTFETNEAVRTIKKIGPIGSNRVQ